MIKKHERFILFFCFLFLSSLRVFSLGKDCEKEYKFNQILNSKKIKTRALTLSPLELYGEYSCVAFKKLKSLRPSFVKLLKYPEIIYRLDDFISYAKKRLKLDSKLEFRVLKNDFLKQDAVRTTAPRTQKSHFLLGDFPKIRNNILDFFHQVHQQHGPLVKINIPTQNMYLVFDPELARQILFDKDHFIKGSSIDSFRKTIFAPEGLIFMESTKKWAKIHRYFFEGPLNPREFPERYGTLLHENIVWLFKRWKQYQRNNTSFNLYEEINNFTMRTMAKALFNYKLTDKDLSTYLEAFKFILEATQEEQLSLIKIPLFIPSKRNRKFNFYLRHFRSLVEKIIKEDDGVIKTSKGDYPTLISLLKQYEDPVTHKKLSFEALKSHVMTLFFAAHDTTSNVITMAVYHLLKDQTLKEQLKRELESQEGSEHKLWSPMGKIPGLENFQSEILRLYPSVPIIGRESTQSMTYGGYKFKKRTTFLISTQQIGVNPRYYKNPLQFNPGRWDASKESYNPFILKSFSPFGMGPRRCLGQWFAQYEIRTFLSYFLRENLDLELLEPCKKVSLKMVCTGLPNRTIKVRFSKKKSPIRSSLKKSLSKFQTWTGSLFVLDIKEQSSKVRTYRLGIKGKKNLPFNYFPGAHLVFYKENKDDTFYSRNYTISSSPTESKKWLEITVKKEDKGFISKFIHEHLAKGVSVNLRAPMGNPILNKVVKDSAKELVFISGGIGITPMRSFVKYLLDKAYPSNIYFIYSDRKFNELVFYDELTSWSKSYPHFNLNITLTRGKTSHLWQGLTGRLNTEILRRLIPKIKDKEIFLCGSNGFAAAVLRSLQELEVSRGQITVYSFGEKSLSKKASRVVSQKELACHNHMRSAWFAFENKIYDLTEYISQHPGGEILLSYAGKDITADFHLLGHSGKAMNLLTKYYIGQLGL